jgi:hypothetical protein
VQVTCTNGSLDILQQTASCDEGDIPPVTLILTPVVTQFEYRETFGQIPPFNLQPSDILCHSCPRGIPSSAYPDLDEITTLSPLCAIPMYDTYQVPVTSRHGKTVLAWRVTACLAPRDHCISPQLPIFLLNAIPY